jgi:dTMP kinase
LNEGTTIICDRYAFSGIAFSASKVTSSSSSSSSTTTTTTAITKPKLPFEWCRAPDIGLPSPDLVLFLDIAPDQARQRGGYGEERYEKEEMQVRVREAFRRLGDEMQASRLGDDTRAPRLGDDTQTSSSSSSLASSDANNPDTKWMVIDAGKERDIVSEEIWKHVEPLVSGGGLEAPVGRLWSGRMV